MAELNSRTVERESTILEGSEIYPWTKNPQDRMTVGQRFEELVQSFQQQDVCYQKARGSFKHNGTCFQQRGTKIQQSGLGFQEIEVRPRGESSFQEEPALGPSLPVPTGVDEEAVISFEELGVSYKHWESKPSEETSSKVGANIFRVIQHRFDDPQDSNNHMNRNSAVLSSYSRYATHVYCHNYFFLTKTIENMNHKTFYNI